MAAPGVAVPGSVVAIGSQASPAGPQGIQGPALVSAFVTKTAAYTLTTSDSGKYVICSGGSWTLTLPAPASGLVFQVRNDMGISGTTGTITLSPTGGTIDGLASMALLPQQECTLLTDGTNWRTYGRQRTVILGTQDITSSTASGTVLLPVGYRYFELLFSGVVAATSNDLLQGQLSLDGGSTWKTTNYYHGILYDPTISTAGFSNTENGPTLFIVPQGTNSAIAAGQGKLVIFPGDAIRWPTWTVDAITRNTSNFQNKWSAGGIYNNPGPANALKYFMQTGGNISSCFLTVKGVV